MRVADFLVPATVLDERATLAEALSLLERGEPAFFAVLDQFHVLTAETTAGYPLSRRLIDLPSKRVSAVSPDESIESLEAFAGEVVVVRDAGGIVGYVDQRQVCCTLSTPHDPRELELLRLLQTLPGFLHDIANSLTVSAGAMEMLSGRSDDMSAARASLQHSFAMVGHLRQLFVGGSEGAVQPMELATVLVEVGNLVRASLGPSIAFELLFERERGSFRVCARPLLLERVLLNLVVNASEALRGRGRVRLSCESGPPGFVDLFLDDDGPGVLPAVASTLFKGQVSSKLGANRGLGLSSAATALQQDGGSIQSVSSRLGGATFRLRLPMAA